MRRVPPVAWLRTVQHVIPCIVGGQDVLFFVFLFFLGVFEETISKKFLELLTQKKRKEMKRNEKNGRRV